MLVNISMKFHEDILNGFQITERKRFVTETATYKVQGGITKNIYIYPRVMVLAICTLSNVG